MKNIKVEAGIYVCRSTLATFDLIFDAKSIWGMIEVYHDEELDYNFDEAVHWITNNLSPIEIYEFLLPGSKLKMEHCYKLFGNGEDESDYYDTYIRYVLDNGNFFEY